MKPSPVRIKVSYFGHLRLKAGIKSEIVETDDPSTVGDVLESVCSKRGISDDILEGSRGTQPAVNILLNGRNVRFLSGMNSKLEDGSEISIFPPTGGG